MIKYRLKFNYKKYAINPDRENSLNELLSDVNSIESDNPIRKPLEGEIIIVSEEEYRVEKVSLSFESVDDITYYDFIVYLKRFIEYKETKSETERLKELMKGYQDDIKKEWDYKKYMKDQLGQNYK